MKMENNELPYKIKKKKLIKKVKKSLTNNGFFELKDIYSVSESETLINDVIIATKKVIKKQLIKTL